ncbi:MAG TPA: C25 family cysteine peptidase [Candidatus Thermoplasmatota archaeon]|nr:C25 family cysteine peptidase [Candidatus Thermoplasmatota archaeon]
MKSKEFTSWKVSVVLGIFLLLAMAPGVVQAHASEIKVLSDTIVCSTPALQTDGRFVEVVVPEADAVTTVEGSPLLPVITKTCEFPLGTTIQSIIIQPLSIQTMSINGQVRPVPVQLKVGADIVPVDDVTDQTVYSSAAAYPSAWSTYTLGAGLNTRNEHVLIVSCRLTPVHYLPLSDVLQFCTKFTVNIEYTLPASAPKSATTYALVIIAPSEYAAALQPLVNHKNNYSMPATLVTLDQIYGSYPGRDNPERIKYFIKHAVEDWNTQYVLLVGDIKKMPIRETYGTQWETTCLTDQYYADIYNANGDFCSWDKNGNNRFGETTHQGTDLDGVDLYADVNVGRLACTDVSEVNTVVNKIIIYEEQTATQIWFKHMILCGGDTFPLSRGAPPFVYEGEITNTAVGQTLPDFSQTYLWTSKHNLHWWSFNREINKGAGFVTYAGHGFEHGWGTYRPNALTDSPIFYYIPYLKGLHNGDKLPIVFFDACLTAKLDFNFSSLQQYYPFVANSLAHIFTLSTNTSDNYECFAWDFLAMQNGGAIATVGATRSAYTWVDKNGVYGGAGYLDVHFFASYHDGVTLGQMLTGGQNAYIQGVGKDYFTIEEFLLLGDPSLMVGGYQ